ncbi:TonB-dependent receptor plug domain-containing protein [Dyadobacter sandarakinus]|uniref:TonB-dependent receptor n=1 Tax=Dyadobacter sandarakinus TaxID=2747268 RepID=A0ABX7I142_9BACT|nr:TonB-dependent receptor [Dyadobacter sandarakinus]QRQ99778.1 TonB-dependent receptor [Dyadobacter sandarakinus]
MRKHVTFLFLVSASLAKAQVQTDTLKTKSLQEVVVTASRLTESILVSPVSVQKINRESIALSPAISFFDGLENAQGIHMITPSLGFKVLNARGFSNTTNVRFAQLVDGMDVQSPHIGGAIGNALGPTDLDIANIEILPGTASALYGMNTVNGLANFFTKNPFTSEGLSIQQKTAVNHINDRQSNAKPFSETTVRFAKVISPKWAFKVNGAFTKGYDWIASDQTELNANANRSTNLFGTDNPAQDPVNGYGNESSNRRTIALAGRNYVVARTGYQEMNVVSYDLQNVKADAGIYYKVAQDAVLTYSYHFSELDNVYQRANRFRLQDYRLQQHALQYQSGSIQAKLYINSENTGKSYNLRSMAENMDRSFKPDNVWYTDFTNGFNQALTGESSVADALREARGIADAGRYQPGTPAFNQQLKKLQDINNWDAGAALRVKASLVHGEIQVNLTENYLQSLKTKYDLDLLAGADHRTYIIVPDGNYFINPEQGQEGKNINYSKTGAFISVSKGLFQSRLKLGAILRADKNDYFKTTFNPRFSAVYSPVHHHNIRASFQSGYRFPSIFEAYSNVNSGGVKRVGGLPVMSRGIFENAWLATSISAFQTAVLADINQAGLTQAAAIEKNKGLLRKNPYTYLKPEHARTWEAGYKGLFLNNSLYANADVYLSRFSNFIAQANMNVPDATNEAAIPAALYTRATQAQYRMYTNSRSVIDNFGFSAGLNYQWHKTLILAANTTFSKLRNTENQDGLEDGFNTPKWIYNISVSKKNLAKNMDATLAYRWQSKYLSQTFLVSGQVPAYSSLDAQLSYHIPLIRSLVKLGATNILNHYYNSFLGGPSIGGMYYVSVGYGINK